MYSLPEVTRKTQMFKESNENEEEKSRNISLSLSLSLIQVTNTDLPPILPGCQGFIQVTETGVCCCVSYNGCQQLDSRRPP